MQIHDLSLQERKPVEDIWHRIAVDQDALPITSEQRGELDRRLRAYRL